MEEKRQDPRHHKRTASSVFIIAPELSEGPIEPVDFSSGGFGLKLSRCPLLGTTVSCTLHIGGVTLSGISARVAWTREEASPPRTWAAGLAIQFEEGERDELLIALSGLLAEIAAGS
ncbi:MAG: PilZ domain-containing protein [Candidatus Tectomicrobia bacterium]|uniref:PilZ domain-containing protein n=1 Tax=Tectimicrobiota bacterium TaxID=2528274 RepID=A0A932I1H9_UNCTE|nr:PilZ domain-containing protein [Candidatus Tectomicrobia bacterium]